MNKQEVLSELREKIKKEDYEYEDDGNTQFYLGYITALEWVMARIDETIAKNEEVIQ